MLIAGRRADTDVLAALARAMDAKAAGDAVALLPVLPLLLALYAGAPTGSLTAGSWRATGASPAQWLRCFAGGVVMGWGSLLIPGSNDGLILIGVPLLRPYAWLAFASMFGTIAPAMQIGRADWQARVWRRAA